MNESHEQSFFAMTGLDKADQQSQFIEGYLYQNPCDPVQAEDLEVLDRYIELCPDSEPQFKEALISLRKVFQFIA